MARAKIDLKKSHTLLYRGVISSIVFAFAAGTGLIFLPDMFFYLSKSYPFVIGQYVPAQIWGALWYASAFMMLSVFGGINYKVAQIGMVLFASICVAWSVGLILLPLVNAAPAPLGAMIWAYAAVRTFIMAFEPPINPATAIKLDDGGKE